MGPVLRSMADAGCRRLCPAGVVYARAENAAAAADRGCRRWGLRAITPAPSAPPTSSSWTWWARLDMLGVLLLGSCVVGTPPSPIGPGEVREAGVCCVSGCVYVVAGTCAVRRGGTTSGGGGNGAGTTPWSMVVVALLPGCCMGAAGSEVYKTRAPKAEGVDCGAPPPPPPPPPLPGSSRPAMGRRCGGESVDAPGEAEPGDERGGGVRSACCVAWRRSTAGCGSGPGVVEFSRPPPEADVVHATSKTGPGSVTCGSRRANTSARFGERRWLLWTCD